MAESSSSKLSLKLFVHTKQQKVIFAEVGKSAIEFLFHLLTLPIGTIIRLISKEKMTGSFGNLFESIQNLEQTYILPGATRDAFLKPTVSVPNTAVLKGPLFSLPDITQPAIKPQYRCSSGHSTYCHQYVSYDPRALCPSCGKTISLQMHLVYSEAEKIKLSGKGGGGDGEVGVDGFVKGIMRYMVMDDLVVKPMSAISFVEACNKFRVSDVGDLVEKHVELGSDEALNLLEASLVSNSVLTTTFLKKMVRNVEISCEESSNRSKYKSLS